MNAKKCVGNANEVLFNFVKEEDLFPAGSPETALLKDSQPAGSFIVDNGNSCSKTVVYEGKAVCFDYDDMKTEHVVELLERLMQKFFFRSNLTKTE